MAPDMELGVCTQTGKQRDLGVAHLWEGLIAAYLSLGGGEGLPLHGRVGAAGLAAQQRLAVHLGLQAGDVAAAEVLAQVAHLLQLQQVDPEHLDGLHHLHIGKQTARVVSMDPAAVLILQPRPFWTLIQNTTEKLSSNIPGIQT